MFSDHISSAETPKPVLQPWFFVLWCLSGCMNKDERDRIEYLRTENAVLREKLGKKRILLSDDQRRRLAVAGKVLGRKTLGEIGSLFSPDTILAWHRRLVAAHHTHNRNSVGRPAVSDDIVKLVVRLANENPTWGCDRIAGELAKLGHVLSDTSVENILKRSGIEPAPRRKSKTSWSEFLAAHWDSLAAMDFTTVDVWTPTGLKTVYLLFVIELKTRRVQYLGSTANPNESWMLDAVDRATFPPGRLAFEDHPTILLIDRDTKYTEQFKAKLKAVGIKPQTLPPRSPNLNAYIERFMLTFKTELIPRMIFFGKGSLDHATEEFLKHYHAERPHQGLANQRIDSPDEPPEATLPIRCDHRLGGLLKSYHRAAA